MIRRVLALLVVATTAFGSTARTDRRLYRFRCVDEGGAIRKTLYAAEVEGPPDADFQVTLRDARHQIEVTFVNEPLPSGGVESRIHLQSRRAWGLSPNGLTLWEEDDQRHRVQVGPDEQIDLLPFGGRGEAGLLKIEITPETVSQPGIARQPLTIHITQQAPDGAIDVAAYRSPHWYSADVAMVRNGVAAAHAGGRLFVDEGGTVALGGTEVHITPAVVPTARWELVSMRIDAPFAHGRTAVALVGKPQVFPIDDQQQLVVTLRPEGDTP